MIQPTVGFIVYGVHKDGLKDPMGAPFIDNAIVKRSKAALRQAGHQVERIVLPKGSPPEAVEAEHLPALLAALVAAELRREQRVIARIGGGRRQCQAGGTSRRSARRKTIWSG